MPVNFRLLSITHLHGCDDLPKLLLHRPPFTLNFKLARFYLALNFSKKCFESFFLLCKLSLIVNGSLIITATFSQSSLSCSQSVFQFVEIFFDSCQRLDLVTVQSIDFSAIHKMYGKLFALMLKFRSPDEAIFARAQLSKQIFYSVFEG